MNISRCLGWLSYVLGALTSCLGNILRRTSWGEAVILEDFITSASRKPAWTSFYGFWISFISLYVLVFSPDNPLRAQEGTNILYWLYPTVLETEIQVSVPKGTKAMNATSVTQYVSLVANMLIFYFVRSVFVFFFSFLKVSSHSWGFRGCS